SGSAAPDRADRPGPADLGVVHTRGHSNRLCALDVDRADPMRPAVDVESAQAARTTDLPHMRLCGVRAQRAGSRVRAASRSDACRTAAVGGRAPETRAGPGSWIRDPSTVSTQCARGGT